MNTLEQLRQTWKEIGLDRKDFKILLIFILAAVPLVYTLLFLLWFLIFTN